MKQAYIAGPLFDDHEREYLVKIAEIVESFGFNTFLPHRDAGLVTGDFTHEKKVKVFDVDMEYLEPADLVVALLTGRDVDSGTAAEIGYAYKASKKLIGVNANNIKPINNFVWGIFNYGKDIVEDLDQLKKVLSEKYSAT
ncbi:MAG: nucleoside 2-deoxyribosyltransferase [Candidatus Actinomarina sp.]|jgi:nucleoside 2-deoxyribosyltransferase|tara:strand:- start:920 stop:1339 length:420 start_codon:yes stop_codon:yes gene_type:complete